MFEKSLAATESAGPVQLPLAGFPLYGRACKPRPAPVSAEPAPAPIPFLSFVMDSPADDVLDVLSPTQVLDVLEVAHPTAQTVVLATALQFRVLTGLDASRLLSVWVRIESWVTARTDLAIVDVAGDEPATNLDYAREEAALAMRMSPRGACGRVAEARHRTGRVPAVGRALAAASLTRGQAYDLTSRVAILDDTAAAEVCERVLPLALRKSRAEFRTAIEKAILAVDADGAATRHERSRADRSVRLYPLPDGMADLSARLTAVEARSIYDALQATADRDQQPGQRIDHARADALVAWAGTALTDPALRGTRGRRCELRVTATLDALLGFTNDPAHLDGYGPIHPMIARALLPDSTLRRLLTDPTTGHLLDYGRTTYRPPRALTEYVETRDHTCRLVGCGQAARRCDLDHRVAWDTGGPTTPDNLAPLCERHHVMKHTGGWTLHQVHDELMFTTPTGRTYLVHREPTDPATL